MTAYRQAIRVMDEVNRVVVGKEGAVRTIMAAILAGGNVLLDDVPGVGKTTMALAFAAAMKLEYKRMQFTPDVMPSDVIGFSMYDREKGYFRYQPGPVMCNLFLADEINRTSPKTQSALLEAMAERQVTVDGKSFRLPQPFVVIATQNPVGSAGTQLLPESQLDRFAVCLSLGYPSAESEIGILKQKNETPLLQMKPVIDAPALRMMQQETAEVYVHETIYSYMVALAQESRKNESLTLGLSPRATLALCETAKAMAYLDGRDYVLPEDVSGILPAVARHRLILRPQARVSGRTAEEITAEILERVPVPGIRGGQT